MTRGNLGAPRTIKTDYPQDLPLTIGKDSMPIVRSILFLLLLDQVTKLVFRFYGHELDMRLILIQGYLYIDEVVFNYGNAFLPSGTEETGVVSLIISYGVASVALAGVFILFSPLSTKAIPFSQ